MKVVHNSLVATLYSVVLLGNTDFDASHGRSPRTLYSVVLLGNTDFIFCCLKLNQNFI